MEIPHAGRPRCWFAFSEHDFIHKVQATRPPDDGVIFGAITPRELLALQGALPEASALQQGSADAQALAAAYGWDTLLYRADHLLAPGLYQTEEVSEFVAHVAAIAQRLRCCRVYRDEEQAMNALYSDTLYAGPAGFHAHMALREQLIALEVISDDL